MTVFSSESFGMNNSVASTVDLIQPIQHTGGLGLEASQSRQTQQPDLLYNTCFFGAPSMAESSSNPEIQREETARFFPEDGRIGFD